MKPEVKVMLDAIAAMPRETRSELLQYIAANWCHEPVPNEVPCTVKHIDGIECEFCGGTGFVDGPPCGMRTELGELCDHGASASDPRTP